MGRCLCGGEVLGLVGPLGAGKTVFTQSLARGLGVPPAVPVTSPTFVLHRRYAGRCRLEHLDAYRLGSPLDFDALGAGELLDSGAVVVVEWADRVRAVLPARTIWLRFEVTGPTERCLTVELPDPAFLPASTVERLKTLKFPPPLPG
jgi:tRNA threonylcarbamoyladenosine biosynthesis protein TsaE